MSDGQLVGVVLILAVTTAAAWMLAVDYRRVRAARRDLDAHVEQALALFDPDALPVHDAAVRAIRERAEQVAAGEFLGGGEIAGTHVGGCNELCDGQSHYLRGWRR